MYEGGGGGVGGSPHPGGGHHDTFYESYTNHGIHASGSGSILINNHIHQTNYHFSLSNPPGMLGSS